MQQNLVGVLVGTEEINVLFKDGNAAPLRAVHKYNSPSTISWGGSLLCDT